MRAVVAFLIVTLIACPVLAQEMEDKPGEEAASPAPPAKPAPDKAKEDPGLVGARYPHVSPNGRQLAFALRGDLWVVPVEGGRATRLTLNESNDFKPVWSPDGKRIAFTSDRSGSLDVWMMPADGGIPTRLTFDGGSDHICEFNADGSEIFFQSTRQGRWRLYRVSVEGGTPMPISLESASTASVCPADGYVYYQFPISDSLRKGYRGTANDDIYRCKPGEIPERLTPNDQNDREPHISPDGKRLYFTRETGKSGRDFNLHRMDMETRKVTPVTSVDANGISYVSFDKEFKTAYFCWKFRLYSFDLTTEKAEPKLIPVRIVEDTRRDPVAERTATSGATAIDVSKDGSRVAFSLGGSIWTMSSGGGDARQITPPGSGDSAPRFSPDGRRISFYSNTRTGNADLFVMNADGNGLRQITFDKKGDFFQNWTPDGSSLVFCSERSGNKDIWKVGLDGTPPVPLTTAKQVDDDPSVSPDGRLIAYDSWDNGRGNIWVMNADGTGARKVYGTTSQEESPRFSPDGQLLVFTRTLAAGTRGAQEVVVTDLTGSGEARIGRGNNGTFSPDGREIIYLDSRGRIRAAPAPRDIAGGRTIGFRATQTQAQSKQFARVFDEAWNAVNNSFYDKKFHGLSWKKMREKYRPLAVEAATKMEFYYFMGQMIGELSASHQGINGPTSDLPRYSTGLLGCELIPEKMEPVAEEGKKAGKPMLRLKVTKLHLGGPADKAWIREGDYVFGVGTERLEWTDNLNRHLKDTVGKAVTLLVGTSADGSEIRSVSVKPESAGTARARKYQQWIAKCKETVKEKTKGRVAYVHIPQMSGTALRKFQSDLGNRSVQKAKALVLDVRNNGGGNIHQALIDIFSRRHYARNTNRNRPPQKVPNLYWDRPIVLLINRRSFSDAEVFPHAMKTLGLATIVGQATPGAVIGTRDITLSDGSRFRVTLQGYHNLDGTNQEGNGCRPDVVVEMTPEDRITGNDPQLLKAIDVALGKIPKPKPKAPEKPAKEEKPAEGSTPAK